MTPEAERESGPFFGIPFHASEMVPPGCVELHDEKGIVARITVWPPPAVEEREL